MDATVYYRWRVVGQQFHFPTYPMTEEVARAVAQHLGVEIEPVPGTAYTPDPMRAPGARP